MKYLRLFLNIIAMYTRSFIFLAIIIIGGSDKISTVVLQNNKKSSQYFDNNVPHVLHKNAGETAFLCCKVKNLENKIISWIRHRDLHILSVGNYTYTSDTRFSAMCNFSTMECFLKITSVRQTDSGIYECQLNTQPIQAFSITLNVIKSKEDINYQDYGIEDDMIGNDEYQLITSPTCSGNHQVLNANVLEGDELYLIEGDFINITCEIESSTEEKLKCLRWYKDNKVISAYSSREGTRIKTRSFGTTTGSNLIIEHSVTSDSGNYTCSPSYSIAAFIRIHVTNGKKIQIPPNMNNKTYTLKNNNFLIVLVLLYSFKLLPVESENTELNCGTKNQSLDEPS